MNRLEKAAQLALFDSLDVQPKQTLLLMATPKLSSAAQVFRKVAEKAHVEVFFLEIPHAHNKRALLSQLARQFLNSVSQVVLLAQTDFGQPHIHQIFPPAPVSAAQVAALRKALPNAEIQALP